MIPRSLRALALLLALPLALLGCDTADPGDDSFFVNENVEFTFTFDAGDFSGGTATVTSNESTSINLLLGGSGFTSDDVVSVRPRSGTGELLIDEPVTATIDDLESASLRFDGIEVGTASVTMSDDDEDLRLITTAELRSLTGFSGELTITLADGVQPDDYRLRTRLELAIEVLP